MKEKTKSAHPVDSAADANKKPKWISPKLQYIGSLSDIVLQGAGKGTRTNEGQAGGAGSEFKPNT